MSDAEICKRLTLLDFNYSASSPENRKLYDDHIANCDSCRSIQQKKLQTVNRNAIFMVGIGFFLVAQFAVLRFSADRANVLAPAIGVILIISGLVQWVRGKEPHQK